MAKEKKYRSLGVNAFLNAVKSGMSVLFPLITYPYAFRILHAEGIGKVDYATSIISYFSLIAALGISTYAVREGAKLRDDRSRLEEFANQIFSINVITTIISYVALFFCVFIFDSLKQYSTLIWLLSLSIGLTTLGIEWVNTIYEDYLYITVRSIIAHIVTLILLFVLVRLETDYYQYAFLTVVTNAIICFTNWKYCRRYVHIRLTKKLNIKKHMGPVLTLFANSIATSIYVNSDTTMIGAMTGNYFVGIYSIAVKIYNVVKRMLVAMYSVAISRIAFYVGKNDTDKIREIYTSLLSNLTIVLLPASIGLISVAKEVILFMGGEEYLEAIPTLQILSISLIGAVFGGAVTYCLNIPLGRERKNVVATIFSAIINVCLNLILIPLLKQNGAAITTAISEFFVFFYCTFTFKDFKKYIDFKNWGKNFFQAGIGCLTILGVSYMVHYFIGIPMVALLATVIASVLLYGVELILFKNSMTMSILRKLHILH